LMRSRPPSESVVWSAFLTFADRFEDQYWMLTNSAPSSNPDGMFSINSTGHPVAHMSVQRGK
jgi:hypothetical protein